MNQKTTTTYLEKALKTLKSAMSKSQLDDLQRDGAIQRFEYCMELCWKTIKRKMDENAITIDSPRDAFRKAANLGWIEDATPWFKFLEARTKVTYLYLEEIATEVFQIIPDFLNSAEKLVVNLNRLK